ncbi:glycine-rich RNA-binding protein 5, mitochondrial-like [Vicia villosa]|uniref:glycine-rich RNA-binding protein 5, mitochondrial-like n=1 Tax=Vicia villosa TaxID=3911 RepID=UPI00273A9350|nr:glycine-rich RNA-binding protein 5, mitochondrial-like [Vicia villosa]
MEEGKGGGHEDKDKKPPSQPPLPSVQNAGAVSFPGAGGIEQKQTFFGVGVGSTHFFLGNLHWWTTDADVEYELCKYGEVRGLRFFLYEDCGKSQGYCQVEFYDPLAAAACKKGLIGHEFNAAEAVDGINQGGNWDNRGYGRGNCGRGNNLGIGSRGHGNPMRNWGGGMGARPIMMGPMGDYAGFPGGPAPPFPGNLPSYPGFGLRGLAPYGNYSFYGRGMPMHGMGMIPSSGMYVPNMGMWPGPDIGRWGGDEDDGGKVAESGYGEEAASDHQYDEVDRDRGELPNAMREKERGSERDLPGTSERTFKDDRVHEIDRCVPSENNSDKYVRDRERGRNLDRHREDRDKYGDHHRFKDQSRKYSHNGKRR